MCLFCNKTINGNSKTQIFNKAKVIIEYSEEISVFRLRTYSIFGEWEGKEGGVAVGAYLSLSESRREVGWRWALIRGWVLINFFFL